MKKLLSSIAGITAMLLFVAIILMLQGYSPIGVYYSILEYSIFSSTAIKGTINIFVPLLFTALSATLAFGSGATNLGQPGQFLMGAFFVTVVGTNINAPSIIMIPMLLISGMLGGGLYALISALLKSKFNMNEFISSLMLNFIAEFFTLYMITAPMFDRTMQSPASKAINKSGWLGYIGEIPTTLIIAILFSVLLYLFWSKSKIGYEMKMMGNSSLFSLLGGCKNKKNFTLIMFVSGALAGISGAIIIMGPDMQHRFLKNLGTGYAWDGIMIAMISVSNIPASFFYSILIAIFQTGSLGMELEHKVPVEFVLLIQAMLVIFVVTSNHIANIITPKILILNQIRKMKKTNAPQGK